MEITFVCVNKAEEREIVSHYSFRLPIASHAAVLFPGYLVLGLLLFYPALPHHHPPKHLLVIAHTQPGDYMSVAALGKR
jgi:hypothetical protein